MLKPSTRTTKNLQHVLYNCKHKHNVFDYTSCAIGMVNDAVPIVWFCYELMIFSNKKCKIIIKSQI